MNKDQGPAPLDALEDLLNTDSRFHGVDVLRQPDGMQRLARHLSLTGDLGDGDDVIRLRDALRALVTGEPGAAALEDVAARHPLRFVVDGGLRMRGDDGVAEILAMLQESVAAGTWARLRACRNPDCQWIYYDGSKNRSGRWCSTECSHVMRSRAYRARRADA